MILSTLGLDPRDFALGLSKRSHTNRDIIHTYKPMISSTSTQCGTLVTHPTEIFVSLGLDDGYMEKALNLESGLQFVVANLYPPCPEPEVAMGMPSHSDHGLLTLLLHNGISSLQVQHKGKWINVNSLPNAFVVNIGDHLEIVSNGKYKSVLHPATVNEKATRISIATVFALSLDTVVSPAPELVNLESNPPAFTGMKYREYLEMEQSNKLDGKSCLHHVRNLAV